MGRRDACEQSAADPFSSEKKKPPVITREHPAVATLPRRHSRHGGISGSRGDTERRSTFLLLLIQDGEQDAVPMTTSDPGHGRAKERRDATRKSDAPPPPHSRWWIGATPKGCRVALVRMHCVLQLHRRRYRPVHGGATRCPHDNTLDPVAFVVEPQIAYCENRRPSVPSTCHNGYKYRGAASLSTHR